MFTIRRKTSRTGLNSYTIVMVPSERDYSDDGIDLTLIDWMLSLSPAQRLQVLQKQINRVLAIRELNDRI
jgi:hypothetical protein